jgi:hypothetical protein
MTTDERYAAPSAVAAALDSRSAFRNDAASPTILVQGVVDLRIAQVSARLQLEQALPTVGAPATDADPHEPNRILLLGDLAATLIDRQA